MRLLSNMMDWEKYLPPVSLREKNSEWSPRIYFILGRNGMIIPLFFDPSHEINLENNSKKDWILYRHSDILRPITTNRLSRYLRWMPYACGKSQECGISILNTTDTFEQSSTLWQIISHLTWMLTLARLHHLDLEQHAIPCDILVNLAIVWSSSLSINNSHTFKKAVLKTGGGSKCMRLWHTIISKLRVAVIGRHEEIVATCMVAVVIR